MKKKYRNFEIISKVEYININDIIKKIESNKSIKYYLYILHDKDIYTNEDENKNSAHKANTIKDPHYHIYIKLDNAYTFTTVANWLDIKENFINKIMGKWGDVLLYATHKNAPTKHQYDDNEVISNYDWVNERNDYKSKQTDKNKKNEIIENINKGIIRKNNYHNYITIEMYVKYRKDFDTAFKYYEDRIRNMSIDKECIYIYGTSGSGKTTYAKKFCKDRNLTFYISSASNDIMSDYCGEEVLILDDVRADCFNSLSDFLKMLDNNTSSTVKSRYHNKVLECKYIIITSVLDIETLFNKFHDSFHEPIKQLRRRCKTYIHMTDDFITYNLYDESYGDYIKAKTLPNPISKLYKKQRLTEKMINERLAFFIRESENPQDSKNMV
ncbi:MAG: Rep family protein [Massilimicrobiota timonensis]